MKKIREVLRMVLEDGYSHRKTAKATGVSRPTVGEYIAKFRESGLKIDNIQVMSDSALVEVLEQKAIVEEKDKKREELYGLFPGYGKELLKTGVNLRVLWEEYRGINPDGYGYSQFCYHYGVWNNSLELSMRQEYKAGDKLFIDFTGKKLSITDRETGSVTEKEVFVAILGASQYTYVEAADNQKKESLIRACENALRYFGGAPNAIVPDCLKSGVTRGDKYEPDINPEFADFARHYGVCVLPARPHEPRDKAHVENAVKIVYSWIFAALRNRVFYSTEELYQAIREQLELYNSRTMQKLKVSRKELFLETEQNKLKPLPAERYPFKQFARATVQFNYHVYLKEDAHYYSVPYRYRGQKAEIVYSDRVVEIFIDNLRIASYARDRRKHVYTTNRDHMPQNHRWVSEWNPERLTRWGASIGVNVCEMVKRILATREHPEQGYKVCLGLLSLAKKYGNTRLDKACARALSFQHYSYQGVKRILEKGIESFEEEADLFVSAAAHENIRGGQYYDEEVRNDQ